VKTALGTPSGRDGFELRLTGLWTYLHTSHDKMASLPPGNDSTGRSSQFSCSSWLSCIGRRSRSNRNRKPVVRTRGRLIIPTGTGTCYIAVNNVEKESPLTTGQYISTHTALVFYFQH